MKKIIRQIAAEISGPVGVEFRTVSDKIRIGRTTHTIVKNLIEGGLLVIAVLSVGATVLATRRTSTTFDEIVLIAGGARGYEIGKLIEARSGGLAWVRRRQLRLLVLSRLS